MYLDGQSANTKGDSLENYQKYNEKIVRISLQHAIRVFKLISEWQNQIPKGSRILE
ncbi:hypothetical protein T4B_13029 [Trichinella pseudospiralis]|uniref:Uncharacterized protein n=1 Tax=Trichinella pseudospiralis TaxID=6337 RepID=A0A0V1GUE1_TRIPS|nr:hypothetical protein T4B_254 [Trichinella pseudospiralis]KRZ02008.1 hypothetical protein T4B_13029 [Trichinella pseudospiralis]